MQRLGIMSIHAPSCCPTLSLLLRSPPIHQINKMMPKSCPLYPCGGRLPGGAECGVEQIHIMILGNQVSIFLHTFQVLSKHGVIVQQGSQHSIGRRKRGTLLAPPFPLAHLYKLLNPPPLLQARRCLVCNGDEVVIYSRLSLKLPKEADSDWGRATHSSSVKTVLLLRPRGMTPVLLVSMCFLIPVRSR